MAYKDPKNQNKASRKHYQENKQEYIDRAKAVRAEKRLYLAEQKNQPCMDCGVKYPSYVMDFDHRDPSKKMFGPSRIADFGWLKIKAELAKCDLVCVNCHRERTFGPINRHGRSG